ncbi:MAG: hypothetical protein IT379_03540 [Deltaproteobacteria bacterium]|nr:hypothetical protein [Deltaproteobacteria bacterium]
MGVAALALLTACDVYDASLLDDVDGGASLDLSMEATVDLGSDADPPPPDDGPGPDDDETPPPPPPDMGPPGCVPRRPPERPVLSDPASTPVRWYAMRDLRVGMGEQWRSLGYDLDGFCSDVDSTESECAPSEGFGVTMDGDDGVDNAFGQTFIQLITLLQPEYESLANARIDVGEYGILVRLAEWNGTANDPVVDVALVDASRGFAMGADPTAVLEPPEWNGSDEWIASTRSFAAGDTTRPLARDTAGFVVDNVLVAHPRDGTELSITSDRTVTLKLTGVILTARIDDGNRRLVDGIVAGRWALDDIFNTLPRAFICPDTDQYRGAQTALDRAADVTVDGEPTPFLRCEAISVGVGFSGTLSTIHSYGDGRVIRDVCAEPDLCDDTCSSAMNGRCDDGGQGSVSIQCTYGTDCADCGVRL